MAIYLDFSDGIVWQVASERGVFVAVPAELGDTVARRWAVRVLNYQLYGLL